MNIDQIANLIESADVPTFRTIAARFLRSAGYPNAFMSDGSYDGGADLYVETNLNTGVQTVFQLSTENDWKGKLAGDLTKARKNYPKMTAFVFVSKRRMPLRTFSRLNAELVSKHGMGAVHYDSQAIATEFIDKNLVADLYRFIGIPFSVPAQNQREFSTKLEASSALLLFGDEASDFRSAMMENLVISEAIRGTYTSVDGLTDHIVAEHSFDFLQRPDIVKHVTRAMMAGSLALKNGVIVPSEAQKKRHEGLKASFLADLSALQKEAEAKLDVAGLKASSSIRKELLDRFITLCIAIVRRVSPSSESHGSDQVDAEYQAIRATIGAQLGGDATEKLVRELTEIVAASHIAKHVSAAELFSSMLHAKSPQLVAALGGTKGVCVYFDTPVAIPLICGLLFDAVDNHAAYSAKLLVDLLGKHKYSAFVPSPYIEEMAAHLIECCRNYSTLLEAGEDLTHSKNAFASHYSQISKSESYCGESVDEYLSIFGSPPANRYSDLSDEFFYETRDRIISGIKSIFVRYGVSCLELKDLHKPSLTGKLEDIWQKINRPKNSLLLRHDAQVISFLESASVEAGVAKIFCTWDSVHFRYNESWQNYCVMNPACVTDVLSVIRSDSQSKVAQLIDYVMMQSEASLKLSVAIWDQIVAIEKGGLSDASLMLKANAFRAAYMNSHQSETTFEDADIGSLWLRWKQSAE